MKPTIMNNKLKKRFLFLSKIKMTKRFQKVKVSQIPRPRVKKMRIKESLNKMMLRNLKINRRRGITFISINFYGQI